MSKHRRCYVVNCVGEKKGSESRESISFFKIPAVIKSQDLKTDELSCERQRLWLQKLRLSSYDDINKIRICSRHFYSGKPSKLYDQTNPDWVPNLCLGDTNSKSADVGQHKIERHERRLKRSLLKYATSVSRKGNDASTPIRGIHKTPLRVTQRSYYPLLEQDLNSSPIDKTTTSIAFEETTISDVTVSEECVSSVWDESGVSLIWNETGSLLVEGANQSTSIVKKDYSASILDEGIGTSSSISEKEGNYATTTHSHKAIQTSLEYVESNTQCEVTRRDFSTQTDMKEEKETVDSATQAGNKSVEHSSQTSIRFCERFELEYAEIKIEESRKEIAQLNKQVEESNTMLNLCKDQINSLVAEVGNLEEELGQHKYTEFYFRDEKSDEKVLFFTGLQSLEALLIIVKQVSPFLFQKSKLTLFQQVILTIMKLRLAVTNKDLAFRFWVSEATVGRIFYNTLNGLYNRFHKFVRWPERDELWATMPMCFREKFGKNVAVIIDCFEVFTCKPSSVKSKAETYSHYKSCNTVKFLIGVTPQGSVSFISKGWGGRVSDKHLTENSGLLEKLLPGDLVLADRGFNIDDAVGFCCATIKYPTFTKGKSQLSPLDVESTRKLANVRIHVERIIGHLRQKYAILFTKVPIELLQVAPEEEMAVLDKIAIVCSALTNLTPSVVPFD